MIEQRLKEIRKSLDTQLNFDVNGSVCVADEPYIALKQKDAILLIALIDTILGFGGKELLKKVR